MSKIKIAESELYQDSVTGDLYRLSPDGTFTQISTSGAAHVVFGGIGPNVDRQVLAPGVTQGVFSWPVGLGPKSIRVRLSNDTDEATVKIVFDAPTTAANDPVATAWLADVGSATTDKMHRTLKQVDTAQANSVGEAGWTEFNFTNPLRSMHYVCSAGAAGSALDVEGN